MTDAFDRFLARCVQSALRSEPFPEFACFTSLSPDTITPETAANKVSFHGIALILLQANPGLTGWPDLLKDRIREEARLQTFWELAHKDTIVAVLDDLGAAGADTVVLKGTALAYSVYSDPALRRRGDSDIMVTGIPRERVRAILARRGFFSTGDVMPLQESWSLCTDYGFDHTIDVHWQFKSSPEVSACLARIIPSAETTPLPKMGSNAVGLNAVDNLFMVAINRESHRVFGIQNGVDKTFDNDRLIWAVDFDLLTRAFTQADWDRVPVLAAKAGCSAIILDALLFAQRTIGTTVPPSVCDALASDTRDQPVTHYYSGLPTAHRFLRDFRASRSLAQKARLLKFHLLPGRIFLAERYPNSGHWPLFALQMRRLISAPGKLLGQSR